METYDIAVIGAGPAGSCFARLAAQGKARILLLDGQTEQNKKPCGGLLAPDAQTVLAELGLTLPASVLVDPQIFSVKTADICENTVRYYPRRYLNMDRFAFDRWMLSLVPECVDKRAGYCKQIRRTESGFSLQYQTPNGQVETVFASNIVGADGGNSLTRRTFYGGYTGRRSIKRYVAIQQWFPAHGTDPFYSCLFDPETSPVCSFSAHKNGEMLYGGMFEPRHCRQAFARQKERVGAIVSLPDEPLRTEACMVCRPRRMRDFITGKDGVFLIGEAAGFISPSSFEGISPALISARALADAFCRAKNGKEVARRYRKNTASLRRKLLGKCVKRIFMYRPFLRKAVMKSGLCALRVPPKEPSRAVLPRVTEGSRF